MQVMSAHHFIIRGSAAGSRQQAVQGGHAALGMEGVGVRGLE